jgi:hypothetical protein
MVRTVKRHLPGIALARAAATLLDAAPRPNSSSSSSSGSSSRLDGAPTVVVAWAGPDDHARASAAAARFGLPLLARAALLDHAGGGDSLAHVAEFALQFAGPAEEAQLELHGLPLPGGRGRPGARLSSDSTSLSSTSSGGTKRERRAQESGDRPPQPPLIGPLAVDFVALRDGRGSQSSGAELVVKACKGKKGGLGLVWDLTAGLGRDAALLALASTTGGVVMFERSAAVGALLDDALRRLAIDEGCDYRGLGGVEDVGGDGGGDAGDDGDADEGGDDDERISGDEVLSSEDYFFAAAAAGRGRVGAGRSSGDLSERLRLVAGDAVALLAGGPAGPRQAPPASDARAAPLVARGAALLAAAAGAPCGEQWRGAQRPDVVYLDPMFPPRQKSALVKGEMQLLHRLLHPRAVVAGPFAAAAAPEALASGNTSKARSPATAAPKRQRSRRDWRC